MYKSHVNDLSSVEFTQVHVSPSYKKKVESQRVNESIISRGKPMQNLAVQYN